MGSTKKDTFFYLDECLTTLWYPRKNQICNSNLKPDNISIMTNSHIKIIDFGVSKMVRWGQTRNSFVGTDESMAPEVYIQLIHSFLVDIWSFRDVSYELFYLELAVPFKKKPRGTKRSIIYSAKVILVLIASALLTGACMLNNAGDLLPKNLYCLFMSLNLICH